MDEFYFTDLDKQIQQKLSDYDLYQEGANGQERTPSSDELLFDAYIHSTLSVYETPFSTWDWVKMSEILESQQFDEQVKQVFQPNLTIAPLPDWESFVSDWEDRNWEIELRAKLETAAETVSPDFEDFESAWQQKQLDTHFQTELSSYESTHPQSDWADMQKDLPLLQFDEAIRSKLAAHNFPYKSQDWSLFLKQLHPQSYRKYGAILTLLLLLLGVGGYYYNYKGVIPSRTSKNANSTNTITKSPTNPTISSNENVIIPPNPTTHLPTDASSPIKKNFHANKTPHSQQLQNLYTETPTSISFLQQTPSPTTTAVLTEEVAVATTTTPVSPDVVVSVTNSNLATETAPQAVSPSSFQSSDFKIANYVSLPFEAEKRGLKDGFASPDKKSAEVSSLKWEVYGAVLGSLAELKDTLHRGESFGLRTEIGLWKGGSLVTGFLMSNRNFSTVYYKYSAYHDIARKNLLMGNVQSVDFPVMIKQQTHLGKHWAVYVQGGVVSSLSLSEKYTHYDPTSTPNLQLPDDALARMRPTQDDTRYRPYVGNLAAATGIEYHQKRLYVGVEPAFQWAIQPLSKEQRRVHSVALALKAGINIGK